MNTTRLFSFAAILIGAAVCFASDDASESPAHKKLSAVLGPMIEAHRGVVTIGFKHLDSGESFSHQADLPMPSASMVKLPIMMAAYEAAAKGELSLDDLVTLDASDKVGGSGLLSLHFSDGVSFTLRDTIRLMMAYSDNTATNLVIKALGGAPEGIHRVNGLMDRLGCPGTRLNSYVFDRSTTVDQARSDEFGLGMMNANETIALLEKIQSRDPFGSGVGEGHGKADTAGIAKMCEEMLDHLRSPDGGSMVPRRLPDGVVVAHKGGAVSNSRCDGGIIESPAGPIVYCLMTAKNEDTSWGEDNEAYVLAGEVGLAAYRYFTKAEGGVEAPRVARVLRVGADGPLVEAMQRTLNRRLKTDSKIGVDGDFGPNTEKAVKAFQRQEGLEPNGKVDSAFWTALGPLVMEDDPAPPPAQVNKELLPRRAQDSLEGPPVTTCKAWAIANGETGKVLWGYNDSVVRDPASTTKMMTAYVVVCLAEEDPAVLDEVITFTERADNTSGSTADVRAGEKVTVRELLYGLMLPSGNDASVAFGEHFGGRLPGEEGQGAYERFVAAMNAKAAELGMDETGYRNTHGLTDEGHVTSARDLVKLAHAAMQNEVFREVVATRRRGATLDSVDGYQRNVVWNNTDRLLEFEGYYGVKTGTTGPAGACLVSAGSRGDKPLYVVVLGSTSGDARYIDARNLYRWAWKELGLE